MYEPMQMLGEVEEDVLKALGVDVVGVAPNIVCFGYENKDGKSGVSRTAQRYWWGTVFNTTVDKRETLLFTPKETELLDRAE